MRRRTTPLDDPPDRPPYFVVALGGDLGDVWLVSPSAARSASLARCIGPEHVATVWSAMAVAEAGSVEQLGAMMRAVQGVPALLELVGALVGYGWADPVLELETAPPPRDADVDALRAFGAEVLEELHLGGVSLSQQVGIGMALLDQIVDAWKFDADVRARVSDFVSRMAPTALPSA